MSRYSERRDDGRPDHSRTITDLTVTVLEPGPEQPPLPTTSRDDRYTAPAQRRRHRILALLQDDPTRLWRPAEIAAHFGDITLPGLGSRPDGDVKHQWCPTGQAQHHSETPGVISMF